MTCYPTHLLAASVECARCVYASALSNGVICRSRFVARLSIMAINGEVIFLLQKQIVFYSIWKVFTVNFTSPENLYIAMESSVERYMDEMWFKFYNHRPVYPT